VPATRNAARATTLEPDLVAFRDGVDNLLFDLAAHGGSGLGPGDAAKTEAVLIERLIEPQFTPVLAGTPRGLAGCLSYLLDEVRGYTPSARSSASDLCAQVRIYLLAQVEAMWWGYLRPYGTTAEVCAAPELIDLEVLRRAGRLPFHYRRQPRSIAGRAVRAVERRVAPERTPRTAGLRFAAARPEVVALIGQVAAELADRAPASTPPLWVTSATRSVAHQERLRSLGYAAMDPSAHCVGWAVDVEMAWFGRFGAREELERILLERQDAGDVNVIDEGQAWHVCVSPSAAGGLRTAFIDHFGS
jgi:hypothetical protein